MFHAHVFSHMTDAVDVTKTATIWSNYPAAVPPFSYELAYLAQRREHRTLSRSTLHPQQSIPVTNSFSQKSIVQGAIA